MRIHEYTQANGPGVLVVAKARSLTAAGPPAALVALLYRFTSRVTT